jgi:hypothetical protein
VNVAWPYRQPYSIEKRIFRVKIIRVAEKKEESRTFHRAHMDPMHQMQARGCRYYCTNLSVERTSYILTEPSAKPAAKCPEQT